MSEGIDETMSIDGCLHSLFGASKVAADVLTQEYGRYFGLRTGAFRGGCLTGPHHSGVELHRSEEHTSELQSLMRISYAVFCLKKKTTHIHTTKIYTLRSKSTH